MKKIDRLIEQYLSEEFISADKALDVILGYDRSGLSLMDRMISAVFEKKGAKHNAKAIREQLKGLGMSDDEISELRDIYSLVNKYAIEKVIRIGMSENWLKPDKAIEDYMYTDKSSFGIYRIDAWLEDYNYKGVRGKVENELRGVFKEMYEKRLKNRKYGKV